MLKKIKNSNCFVKIKSFDEKSSDKFFILSFVMLLIPLTFATERYYLFELNLVEEIISFFIIVFLSYAFSTKTKHCIMLFSVSFIIFITLCWKYEQPTEGFLTNFYTKEQIEEHKADAEFNEIIIKLLEDIDKEGN
jgi:hypothetical protein